MLSRGYFIGLGFEVDADDLGVLGVTADFDFKNVVVNGFHFVDTAGHFLQSVLYLFRILFGGVVFASASASATVSFTDVDFIYLGERDDLVRLSSDRRVVDEV
jgi:hypothetical protein